MSGMQVEKRGNPGGWRLFLGNDLGARYQFSCQQAYVTWPSGLISANVVWLPPYRCQGQHAMTEKWWSRPRKSSPQPLTPLKNSGCSAWPGVQRASKDWAGRSWSGFGRKMDWKMKSNEVRLILVWPCKNRIILGSLPYLWDMVWVTNWGFYAENFGS